MKVFVVVLFFALSAEAHIVAACSPDELRAIIKITMKTLETALANRSKVKYVLMQGKQKNKSASEIYVESQKQFEEFNVDKGLDELSDYSKKHPECQDAISTTQNIKK
jgi:hypothetical protein